MNKLCILGKNSPICQQLLPKLENYDAFDRTQFDVSNHPKIQMFDFSNYNTVINFAGHSRGSYQSPIDNNWQNYVDQVNVNFIANVLIVKKYMSDNPKGRYIWLSSSTVKNCRPYQAVYGASKSATESVFDLWKKEYPKFKFITIRIGRTKTNHMFNTFESTKTVQEVDKEYNKGPYLDAYHVADAIYQCIDFEHSFAQEILP